MVGALFKALAASQVDGEVNKLTFRLWSMFNLREITTYLLSPKEYSMSSSESFVGAIVGEKTKSCIATT